MSGEKRELLYCWVLDKSLSVLVPKKRGAGFLRTPYGHHDNDVLTSIANEAGSDVYGLDGSLDFTCGGKIFHGGDETRAKYIASVIPRLEKHYGVPAREVTDAEFWQQHPLKDLMKGF